MTVAPERESRETRLLRRKPRARAERVAASAVNSARWAQKAGRSRDAPGEQA